MTNNAPLAKPFNLIRSFSLASLISIVAISTITATLLSQYLRENLLQRDAVVMKEFVQRIVEEQNTSAYFAERDYGRSKSALDDFFDNIAHMPDVVRANVFSSEGTVIWSNDDELIGRTFNDNHELEEALAGQLVVETGKADASTKAEHVSLDSTVDKFVENYIPIRDPESGAIVGAVEVYKKPMVLLETIKKGNQLVWGCVLSGGVLLYLALFWIVRRTSVVMRRQQEILVESEKLAAIGEMASSVAHSIRAPISTIRSSAELALEDANDAVKGYLNDIVTEVDSFEGHLRELVIYSREPAGAAHSSSLAAVVDTSLRGLRQRLSNHEVAVSLELPEVLPPVRGDAALLTEVFNSLFSNAVEAMPDGGRLTVTGEIGRTNVAVRVVDTGSGIAPDRLGDVLSPLVSYKRGGLGMGLALAQRILRRYGGSLDLSSKEGQGTTVLVELPVAS